MVCRSRLHPAYVLWASKQNTATLPIFILLYEWFFFQELSVQWIKSKLLWIAGIIFVSIYNINFLFRKWPYSKDPDNIWRAVIFSLPPSGYWRNSGVIIYYSQPVDFSPSSSAWTWIMTSPYQMPWWHHRKPFCRWPPLPRLIGFAFYRARTESCHCFLHPVVFRQPGDWILHHRVGNHFWTPQPICHPWQRHWWCPQSLFVM